MKNSNEQSAALRIGKVTAFDPEKLRARVNFPDLGIISHWLPILITNSLKTHDELFLDEGEHVACLMAGTGAEFGVIIGALYDDKNLPLVKDKDIRVVTFDDETRIQYDRNNHTLDIDCKGDINIKSTGNISITAKGNISQTAQRIDLN